MVDWDRVRELREEIGREACGEVVSLFFEEVEAAIDRLRAPAGAAEREADLHFLKGSALNLGFTTFGALCAAGEERAAAGAIGEDEIVAVIASYEESRATFESGRAAAGVV